MSSVIATEYNSPYISVLSYGTAAAVGVSRLYKDVHWTSDVVAGAVLGIAIGKASCCLYHKVTSDIFLASTGNSVIIYKKF
jgi:membrane-associated phospholipid phosphatase